MCGRFTLRTRASELAKQLGLFETPAELPPRYNIAPTQAVPIVRASKDGTRRELAMFRWGLVPHWAKDATIGSKMINARAESVAEKPSFRTPLKRQRCLVPADGFYEWQKQGRQKQPFHITLDGGAPFAFAGLWERWDKGPAPLETFTIITTSANDLMRPLHERMPVILPPEAYATWLDPQFTEAERLLPLLRPYPDDAMHATPVSTWVNSPANDDAECLAAAH